MVVLVWLWSDKTRRGNIVRSLLRILLLLLLLALPLSSAFAASAYVHELTGTMTGQYGTAAPRALKIGDTLEEVLKQLAPTPTPVSK